MTMHARIDHAANAVARLTAPAHAVFVFNYPEVEGALLARCPLMGLDLPRKIAVREDEDRKVWISYNDPAWLGRRYNGVGRRSTPYFTPWRPRSPASP